MDPKSHAWTSDALGLGGDDRPSDRATGPSSGSSQAARALVFVHDRLTLNALRVSAILLMLGACVGVLLRIGQVRAIPWLHVANGVHAHSHTLYFGWAGLSLFALMLARVGASARASLVVLSSLGALGFATLAAFYTDGYGRLGIIVSAASLVPFMAAVWLFFRSVKGKRAIDLPYLRLGAILIIVSYVGALSRVVLKLQGLNTVVVGGIAVHMFLGAFGAFFVVVLLGFSLRLTSAKPDPILRWVLSFMPLLPVAPLVVVPNIDLTPFGPLARIAAVASLIPATAWGLYARRFDRVLQSVALAWWLSVVGLALYAVGLIPSLPMQHHAVIAVVHLQTLGVVTTGIIWLFEHQRERPSSLIPLLHQAAALVMIASLGLAALGFSRAGLVGAAAGGVSAWTIQIWAALRILRLRPRGAISSGAISSGERVSSGLGRSRTSPDDAPDGVASLRAGGERR